MVFFFSRKKYLLQIKVITFKKETILTTFDHHEACWKDNHLHYSLSYGYMLNQAQVEDSGFKDSTTSLALKQRT